MFSFHGTVHVRKLYLSLEIGVNRRVSNSGISKVLHWIPQLNRKKIGLYSDEVGGKIVKEACLVKAKSYLVQLHGDESQANVKLAFKGCRTRILDIKYNYAKRFLLGLEKSQIL